MILDPQQAREDTEPLNRAAGGMLQDALSEVPLVKKLEDRLEEAAGDQGSLPTMPWP